MRFKVIERAAHAPDDDPEVIYLMRDGWDDFGYKTLFEAHYRGKFIGGVKIAFQNMAERTSTIDYIPRDFDRLPAEYYSLWPDAKSCQGAYGVYERTGFSIFEALNDISYDLSLFDRVKNEKACTVSLMRGAGATTVRGQLRRITHGKAALTKYSFRFTLGPNGKGGDEQIDFIVTPEELPPSNVHVVIGRNGVGKTHLLNDMALAVCGDGGVPARRALTFDLGQDDLTDEWKCSDFASVLVISFSPFDSYSDVVELAKSGNRGASVPRGSHALCKYVGLNSEFGNLEMSIEKVFKDGAEGCCASFSRFHRWLEALVTLRSDPLFADVLAEAWAMIEQVDWGHVSKGTRQSFSDELKTAFHRLSSGHKAVLSIVTGCVAMLEERSLVLLDEPENHLHPPLLAAFISAFSELLVDFNSAAIVATHSPVVLQEVPASCVWILNRIGDTWISSRPCCETFGANFERLATQVFGVEVDKSGFHKMLRDVALNSQSYEDAQAAFTCGLGDEALGILRVLWGAKEKGSLR